MMKLFCSSKYIREKISFYKDILSKEYYLKKLFLDPHLPLTCLIFLYAALLEKTKIIK